MTGATPVPADRLRAFGTRMIAAMGAAGDVALEVADHLVEADLAGVASHGTMRLAQYAEWVEAGHFDPAGRARLRDGAPVVDGANGFGMPAMRLAVEEAMRRARAGGGAAAAGVVNTGHTGRIGAFAEAAAGAGFLCIILGGGSRREWRQVAPHGGARAMLPTNPYALAVPGGERGPVVLDFATSAGAGGKVYGAKYSGQPVPEGLIVDRAGRPSTNPDDYFDGGALLPMAGPKGYGMALIAELIGAAMLGPAAHGMNWIAVLLDTGAFGDAGAYRAEAEACLAEMRACPPAPGFARVEVPGERERELRAARLSAGVPLPDATIAAIEAAAARLGVPGRLAEG